LFVVVASGAVLPPRPPNVSARAGVAACCCAGCCCCTVDGRAVIGLSTFRIPAPLLPVRHLAEERVLLEAIIEAATRQNYHVLVGGVDALNTGSIRFHEKQGFTHCGTIAQAGFKFGRWLDLAFYQKILSTPSTPVDG
jgi:hypothetical protein